MKKHSGFTLAEVLITLTIIGVVSALTLPSLNTNTGSARNRATLKKALSVLNNAVRMNEARNGWNLANITQKSDVENCDNTDPQENFSMCALLNDALVGETFLGTGTEFNGEYNSRFGVMENILGGSTGALIGYQLSDGIFVGILGFSPNDFNNVSCTEDNDGRTRVCGGFIDVNGRRGPNLEIQCIDPQNTAYLGNEGYDECEVQNNSNADVFPITFYDSTVELASNAARAFFNQ